MNKVSIDKVLEYCDFEDTATWYENNYIKYANLDRYYDDEATHVRDPFEHYELNIDDHRREVNIILAKLIRSLKSSKRKAIGKVPSKLSVSEIRDLISTKRLKRNLEEDEVSNLIQKDPFKAANDAALKPRRGSPLRHKAIRANLGVGKLITLYATSYQWKPITNIRSHKLIHTYSMFLQGGAPGLGKRA